MSIILYVHEIIFFTVFSPWMCIANINPTSITIFWKFNALNVNNYTYKVAWERFDSEECPIKHRGNITTNGTTTYAIQDLEEYSEYNISVRPVGHATEVAKIVETKQAGQNKIASK